VLNDTIESMIDDKFYSLSFEYDKPSVLPLDFFCDGHELEAKKAPAELSYLILKAYEKMEQKA